MDHKDLTEEQRAKVAGASAPEDILRLAQEEGYELSDEELEQISGGWFGLEREVCPKCGSILMLDGPGVPFCLKCDIRK